MKYKENWEVAQEKWKNYWKHQNTGRPLMCVIAKKENAEPLPEALEIKDVSDKYRQAERMVARYRHFCENHEFLAESFPNMSADFGPGSIASYLGSDIIFNQNTVWYKEFVEDWEEIAPFKFDSQNKWFKEHYELVRKCNALAEGDFYIGIPDLIENLDILASMRGAQDLIFDMMDEPERVQERVRQVTAVYFDYYNRFYDLLKDENGDSCYTVFQIWGEGRTVKLQCDFSAMISPDQFRAFVQESLREQSRQIDNVLYHLDGPDAIKHLDAIMEVEGIDALQWTSGDYGPDGVHEAWYVIYDKAIAAGKSLWVKIYTGDLDEWIRGVDKLVKRYGSHSLFLRFPPIARADADKLLAYAEEHWCDIEGSYVAELKAR